MLNIKDMDYIAMLIVQHLDELSGYSEGQKGKVYLECLATLKKVRRMRKKLTG